MGKPLFFSKDQFIEFQTNQPKDNPLASVEIFDVGQLRLRFSVTKPGSPAVNVRFDPWTARFSGFRVEFTWSELIFMPDFCLTKIREAIAQS